MAEHIAGLLAKEKFILRPKEEIQIYLKVDLLQLLLTATHRKSRMSSKLRVIKDNTKKLGNLGVFGFCI